MKKILTILALLLICRNTAFADVCSASLMPTFTAPQATLLCNAFGTFDVLGVSGSNFETVAGAGTVTGDAALLSATKFIHRITGANATVGWRFTADAFKNKANQAHVLLNTTAGVALVYPPTGGTINGGAANAAFTALTGIKPIICVYTSATALICS